VPRAARRTVPDHDILAEELSADRRKWRARTGGCSIRSTAPPLRARPADLLRVAGARARRSADRRRIYDPSRRELFTAERGQGSTVDGPLKTTGTAPIGDALLVTGFPYDMHVRGPELVELFGQFLQRARAVRRLGSAALDLCYVAAGRFDGFWEQHLKPWDVAAGALVVTEAGGRITGMDGAAFDARAGHLVASNGPVHDAMLDVIRGSRAGRTLDRTH
jgi:myo-inositol-1(or 4)-monophosphatase